MSDLFRDWTEAEQQEALALWAEIQALAGELHVEHWPAFPTLVLSALITKRNDLEAARRWRQGRKR